MFSFSTFTSQPFAKKDDYVGQPFYIERVSDFIAKNVETNEGIKNINSWRLVCREPETNDVLIFPVGKNEQRDEMMHALQLAIARGERPVATWAKRSITSRAVGITDMYELEDAQL